jgi:hypothetical protein
MIDERDRAIVAQMLDELPEAESAFIIRMGNTCAGEGMWFAYLMAHACVSYTLMYDSYPDSFRRIKNECGCLIGIEVQGD